MKNIINKLSRANEFFLAKRVLSRIERDSSPEFIKEGYEEYEKLISSKGYRPHNALNLYVKDAYDKHFSNLSENFETPEEHAYKILTKLKASQELRK